MNTVWRLRLLLLVSIGILIFSDILLFGTTKLNGQNEEDDELLGDDFDDQADILEKVLLNEGKNAYRSKLKEIQKQKLLKNLKEQCFPKLLCEISANPSYKVTEREQKLLDLIRSSTFGIALHSSPSKYHYAVHMGQLLRDSYDSYSGNTLGCSELWSKCPYSSKKLRTLST